VPVGFVFIKYSAVKVLDHQCGRDELVRPADQLVPTESRTALTLFSRQRRQLKLLTS
jgi:hypothetical protein